MANLTPRSVDFLPEIFQTSTNRQVLSATLDQLIQEPKLKRIQGFVGRKVGPGVQPADSYIAEPTATRTNYQLEPGVIQTDPTNTQKVVDAITYPGINDALSLQGAITTNADQLYTSEYYSWDPFVDFDKYINYAQYYWLPSGPDSVSVYSGGVPTTENFVVTRANGAYTFSGVAGTDPALTLVRGGTYTFQVAQNNSNTVNIRVGNQGTSAWLLNYEANPNLTLVRGDTYTFTLVTTAPIPFYIKTEQTLGVNNLYTEGVINNGSATGTITFTVPQDAPDTLYYNSATEQNMQGVFTIIDATPGTGPGFWIQTDPGISGNIPATPNISGRLGPVNGVTNNGYDLGTITFKVPHSSDQDSYYALPPIAFNNGQVGLITDLQFDQLNNVFVDEFLAQYPTGIDGITNLNGRTIVFTNTNTDPVSGGWLIESQYDPLVELSTNNGLPGSYDSVPFDQTIPITDVTVQRSVWQIQYITPAGGTRPYISLTSVYDIDDLSKFNIQFGTVYANTSWYKDALGVFQQIPLLTATKNVLFYQDGVDPNIFGEIRIIDESASATLDVNEILGKKNYTSPNGVVFTNGLTVEFVGTVTPASYQNNTYYVEGVGTAIQLLPVSNYVTPETYTQSLSVPYDSTRYDVGNYDEDLNQPIQKDYLTINRASPDLNPWTRSNRWFHISVLEQTAAYNNSTLIIDNTARAFRPILEFRAGTKLFDFGTAGLTPVDVIDFSTTNALATINGQTGYGVDGYNFINGSLVIFAADVDPDVRNQIYEVQFITPDTVEPLIPEPVILLVPISSTPVQINDTTVCLSGNTLQGLSFYFDGVTWQKAQQKTQANQAPLFDVYDVNEVSLSDTVVYPSNNFRGCKLLSYAISDVNGNDPELGFPITYLSLTNIGDIVFTNNLYVDTFVYTVNGVSYTNDVSIGFVRQYSDRTTYSKEIGWQTVAVPSRARQQFQFSYSGYPLQLDVAVLTNAAVPGVQLYVNGEFQESYKYSVATTTNSTTITFVTATYNDGTAFAIGDIIEVDVLSDQASKVGFYQVPINLENNALNVNSPYFTVGTARTHYASICENLLGLKGPINGNNNTRDLGNIVPYGTTIIQNSAPMTLAGYFMRSTQYNIFDSIAYNSREYEQYKAQLLNAAITTDYTNYTIPNMLTAIVTQLVAGRTNINPFYWSDMLPGSKTYTTITSTWTAISTPTFNLNQTYNLTSSNYQGVLVYVNDVILQLGYDYTVSQDAPTLTITRSLNVGDVITIQEYSATYGTFIPNTPTKLGLYPAFRPQIYLDTTYINPTMIILGHDGSKTVAFGDFRDQLLLEFETRIFNNLKIQSEIPLTQADVIPGQFRSTGYSLNDINQILSTSFLSWLGWNKLTYTNQEYIPTNQFTWNYNGSGNRITSSDEQAELSLPVGAWRGIYQYFYDTVTPQSTPWEMLGFSQEPTWWTSIYGPAPYTSGNLVLWDDLAAGKVADPAGTYYRPEYARPGLQQVIPVDGQGNLLSPFTSVVGLYDSSQFQKSWVFGDEGPVEYTWRSSSAYPFAIMRLLALTRPAKFFSLFADRDLYKYDTTLDQFLYNQRYRLNATGLQVYGNGVSKASYIDWIVDYNQQLGVNSTTQLTSDLSQLDVRLCYRMGTFTDQQYLNVYVEKSSPESTNSTLRIPDNSYNLLVYKNEPFNQVLYSSVIVQVVEGGWSVTGYSITNPYFEILASRTTGPTQTISSGGTTVTVPAAYTSNVVQVPYGYIFTNATVVVDFLLSYGALLESQGMTFSVVENGYTLNWNQMAQEFLYWANQGWAVGSVISLSPTATQLSITTPGAVIDSLVVQTPENIVLDQNRTTIDASTLVIDRDGNTFTAQTQTSQYISYMALRNVSYESIVILDNVSVFNDLMYDPATGARQYRINVSASVTADWNGQVNAQGFIYNDPTTVTQWQPLQKYTKGDIVIYKNQYYQAANIVQPASQFNRNDWLPSNYTKIQQGLLQNIALESDQLANSYDVNQANLQLEQDLFAFGLIGFRPRQYMSELNLDDISQVNLYQQLIKDKGTINGVRLLTNATLNNETAQYQVFENWGILRGTYGASANRRFVELQLNEALLTSNPSTVQVIAPQQSSLADQTVPYGALWGSSYNVTSPAIFPTTTVSPTDLALPSAGYVNLDDVDITVFDLEGQLGLATGVLNTIGIGTTVWAAKSTTYDWNVYRSTEVPGYINSATPNLNGTTVLTFTQPPGLSVGDVIVIRYLDSTVDGVYRVLALPSLTSVAIQLKISKTVTNATGLAFSLQTMRVAQASDVVNLPYVNSLLPGAKAWVDNNGSGLWQVLEKIDPFIPGVAINPVVPVTGSKYGTSIAQGYQNVMALVGAPGYDSGAGGIYTYLKNYNNVYGENFILLLSASGTAGFGSAVAIGHQNWAVAGAPASRTNQGYATTIYRATGSTDFVNTQLLISPDGDTTLAQFGTSVAISQDERWMYVSAPGKNKVYAYGRVDQPAQVVEFITTGVAQTYNVNGSIVFSNADQLAVVLNNQLLTLGVDYTVSGTSIALTVTPLAGEPLIVTRKIEQDFAGDASTTVYSLGPYLYTATTINSFTILVDDVLQVPGIDYTFDTGTLQVTFTSAPADGAAIIVTASTYWEPIQTITVSGLDDSAKFGSQISTTTDGRQIVIGASQDSGGGSYPQAGAVYVFDRSVTRYIVNDPTQTTYALPTGFQNPVAVLLNGQYLTNAAQILNGQFSVVSNNVVLSSTVTLNVGDILELESNIFTQVQKIVANAPVQGAGFGSAVDICPYNCSIYTGAPNDGAVLAGAGSVQRNLDQSRVYGTITSTVANPSLTAGNTIRIQNTPVAVPASPNNTVAGLAAAIVAAAIPNITATAANGYLTINVINSAAADQNNKLTVLPGTSGTAFSDLGFVTYDYTQTITSPYPTVSANFGSAVNIDTSATTLVVGAPRGTLFEAEIFDNGTTYFDEHSTTFFDEFAQSGAVYTFDYLPSASDSITDPGQFVFGQQVYDSSVNSLDQWGTAINYTTGTLLVGSPNYNSAGRMGVLNNVSQVPTWQVIHEQQPVVDVALLNSVNMYNRLQSPETYFFDFIDPLQGKILGVARQNINFIGAVDPAQYNYGPDNNNGNFWGHDRVGEIWWNTTNARFIDPNQDDIVYASRRWGQLFPGSTVDVYQWVASSVPPASYTGEGKPYDTVSYTVTAQLNTQGIFETTYYFWVTGLTTINTGAGKTLSTTGIASYILDPRSSGIPYIAALDASTVAIYNGSQYLSASDTILHIDFSQILTDANVHNEFQLIADGDPTSFLANNLYAKLVDSFSGYNATGAQVPDPFLSPAMQYGVQFSPRQSMFVNRFLALQNYLTRANTILATLPIVELRRFIILNSSEPIPAPGSEAYNKVLTTVDQLAYQDLTAVPVGYNYLVTNDSNYNGAWTIYTVIQATTTAKGLQLSRIQNYDTTNYWNYIDWYQVGYSSATNIVAQVPNYASLATLSLPAGSVVKVTANSQNKWELYVYTGATWKRIALQDGTIAFDETLWNYSLGRFGWDVEVYDAQFYDQEPAIETRNIIEAINYELFIDDLAIYRNELLILMFQFILTEEQAPDWLTKTSLIDVRHDIRALLPYQVYHQDNQTFVEDYIQEVKPYHVQIVNFDLVYNGLDLFPGTLTDFDCPAYYDIDLTVPQYVSPILLPYTKSTAVGDGTPSTIADTASNAEIWATTPWSDWINNYLLMLQSVVITNRGSNYVAPPDVTIGTEWQATTAYTIGQQIFYGTNLYTVTVAGTTGTVAPTFTTGTQVDGTATLAYAGTPATGVAVINSQLEVVAVTITNEGAGYTTTPVITLTNGGGSSATASAVMGNDLVRNMNMTIKYDRYEYVSTIVDWSYLVASYPAGTQVRYADTVWQATTTVTNTPITTTATGTAGSYEITLGSATGVNTGLIITGLGIPPEATIVSYTNGSNVVTLDQALLATVIGETVKIYNPFIFEQWTRVDAGSLSGINRTQGYYLPTTSMPGRNLPLLIDGLDYPGVQVYGLDFSYNTGYDVGNYDISPFDNISYTPEGTPTYDPSLLDATYSSSYLDQFLGTRATDINVNGGGYIDTFSSYAPEELVPGSEFDTLDFRVYSAPGSDYSGLGWGFPATSARYTFDPANPVISFAGLLEYPFVNVVFNLTTGIAVEVLPAQIDWVNYEISLDGNPLVNPGDILDLYVTGVGGGNQLYLNTYVGSTVGNQITVPFAIGDISEFLIYNGEFRLVAGTDYTYATATTQSTLITFTDTYTATDRINLAVLGYAPSGPTHSWSLPVFETVISDGSDTINLTNSLQGTNQVNLIITNNGSRLRPYSGGAYLGDSATVTYNLPNNNAYEPADMLDTDVLVYVNNVRLVPNVAYTINAWDGISAYRTITFVTAPATGAKILLSVSTGADYRLTGAGGTILTFQPQAQPMPGDYIELITWNDTSEQGLLNQVYVGPGTSGNNTYPLNVVVTNPERLLVTLNGAWLFNGLGFTLEGTNIVINGDPLESTDVVAVTSFTNVVVPDPEAFRIFQDMRGVQATYRITTSTTTVLTQPVAITDDVIYVEDASALTQPNLASDFNMAFAYNLGDLVIYAQGYYECISPVPALSIPLVIQSISSTGSTVTLNFASALSGLYVVGAEINVSGITPATYNGTFTITAVTATSISYSSTITTPVTSSPIGTAILNTTPTNTTYWMPVQGAANIWGIITIGAERIMYRHRDVDANTVSGLLRGTAGTAIADHSAGTNVYDIGRSNLMPATCQNYVESNVTYPLVSGVNLGDGETTVFTADIDISQVGTTEVVVVYVGGILMQSGYTVTAVNPVTVTFTAPPAVGSEVTIMVTRAHTWYNVDTPNLPLSETDTLCARFLRGL
jgi:hypothetical protein